MDSNAHSSPVTGGAVSRVASRGPAGPPAGPPDALTAGLQELAAEDLDALSDTTPNQELARLQRQLHVFQGQWLRRLAALDARGAAGADQDQPAASTTGWLRRRLRLSASAASGAVRTARALFRGPLAATAQALLAGELSPAHAQAVADGAHQLPGQVVAEAEPVLVEAARQLDPAQLRRLVAQLCLVADPDGADRQRDHRQERRGVWLSPTWDDMVAINGLLEREAGATVLAALEPLARPASADDPRTGSQRNADALAELCRRSLEGGWLPKAGGVRPQLLVTVDLDSLLGRSGGLGGDLGWVGPLDPEACRRLACDGTVTRVLISRQPTHAHRPSGASADHDRAVAHDPTTDHGPATDLDPGATDQSGTGNPSSVQGLQARLRAAMTVLPPTLGGAPRQPLEVGRSTRVVQPAQRAALTVRDGGCVFPGCDRPLSWCDAHHLHHWVDGGPTDLSNLALVCRAHHRAVHEGGWRLIRGPDGRFTAARSPRRPRAA